MHVKPKKSYGQNFLINESVTERIVDSIMTLKQGPNVLEVGPGKGALTKYLVEKPDINFKAVELDWDMIHHLQQTLGLDESQLIQKDFLKLPLEQVYDNEQYNVVGNFPYNISSQILFKVEKYKDLVPVVVGMFQKEVAERIAAGPGSKTYGIISVLLQTSYDAKVLFKVSPGSFFPAPKVQSAILYLKRKEDYTLDCSRSLFKTVVKTTFNKRRKMIRNTLKPLIKDESLFSHRLMDRRPEHLAIEDFIELTNIIDRQEA